MISEKLETRELITLGGGGVLVRGTYHKPTGKTANGAWDSNKSVGVVFVNPLSTPRALIGDSAVYWATSLAARGYPSFRIDLPGLGDSYGETQKDLLSFINNAGYSPITAFKIKELVGSFGLRGAVIYGHCAAATTGIFAAAECKECKGLIVTDPYFNAANLLTPKLRPELVDWARRSRVGNAIRATYARMREVRKTFRNGTLPSNANVALIASWKKVVSSGLPILILKSPHPAALGKLSSGSFDYLGHITSFAVRSNQIVVKEIEDTDHSFANRTGRLAVRQVTESWLGEHFPEANARTSVAQDQGLPVMEINPVTLATPVPAYISSGRIGAL